MRVMGIPKMGWGLGQRVDGVDGSGRVDVPMAEITADHEESSGFVPVSLQSLAEIDEKSSGWVSDKYGNELKVISSIQSAECGERIPPPTPLFGIHAGLCPRGSISCNRSAAMHIHSPSEDVSDIRQVHLQRVLFLVHAGRHGFEQPRLAQLLNRYVRVSAEFPRSH